MQHLKKRHKKHLNAPNRWSVFRASGPRDCDGTGQELRKRSIGGVSREPKDSRQSKASSFWVRDMFVVL